jgi:hypothetical protein
MANLTDMTLTAQRERALIRAGSVVAIDAVAGELTVDVGGVNIIAGYMTHYTPTVGDRVSVAVQDASWLVLGEIVGA